MALSGATVRTALAAVGAGNRLVRSADELAAGADGALRQASGGLTVAGAASWLATMAQESDYFRTTTEYGGAKRYDPYRGRTFEQITWRDNYASFGKWCHAKGLVSDPRVFVNTPTSLGAITATICSPARARSTARRRNSRG
jgi:putative chitinase